MSTEILTAEHLRELLHYDPLTGVFIWKAKVNRKSRVNLGEVAGGKIANGYWRIHVLNRTYKAHRLAWLYVHGRFPAKHIDHINRVKTDNRIANLREATPAENQQNRSLNKNSTSGIRGVFWYSRDSLWGASIRYGKVLVALGKFAEKEEAAAARKAAELKYHPFAAS